MQALRVLALIDGEHHPAVIGWALDIARSRGHDVVAALMLGGTEKLDPARPLDLGIPVVFGGGEDMNASLLQAIDIHRPDAILDLSDEPVLGYRERLGLVSTALSRGISYIGADFRFDPAEQAARLPVPTLAVYSTGKRTGKTAIAGRLARLARSLGLDPIIVAMGRGGPAEPHVALAGTVDLAYLMELSRRGEHAASDYLEDAVTSGVTTIGARRAGGGLAGAPFATNIVSAAGRAIDLGAGSVILEGSGAALPPVPWDGGILVVPASIPLEYLSGYLGPYRLLRSDLVVVTMGLDPAGSENLSAVRSHISRFLGDARHVVTDFVPEPLADVRNARAFFATTAPRTVAARQVQHLEAVHGCTIVGWSPRLADRAGLAEDLERAQEYDVLLTELKAGAIEVGAAKAQARGAGVVFVDNRAVVIEGEKDLDEALGEMIELARERGIS